MAEGEKGKNDVWQWRSQEGGAGAMQEGVIDKKRNRDKKKYQCGLDLVLEKKKREKGGNVSVWKPKVKNRDARMLLRSSIKKEKKKSTNPVARRCPCSAR